MSVEQLDRVRARLDATTDLINQALDLREQLWWGCIDVDVARAAVHRLKRAIREHRLRWR